MKEHTPQKWVGDWANKYDAMSANPSEKACENAAIRLRQPAIEIPDMAAWEMFPASE